MIADRAHLLSGKSFFREKFIIPNTVCAVLTERFLIPLKAAQCDNRRSSECIGREGYYRQRKWG